MNSPCFTVLIPAFFICAALTQDSAVDHQDVMWNKHPGKADCVTAAKPVILSHDDGKMSRASVVLWSLAHLHRSFTWSHWTSDTEAPHGESWTVSSIHSLRVGWSGQRACSALPTTPASENLDLEVTKAALQQWAHYSWWKKCIWQYETGPPRKPPQNHLKDTSILIIFPVPPSFQLLSSRIWSFLAKKRKEYISEAVLLLQLLHCSPVFL